MPCTYHEPDWHLHVTIENLEKYKKELDKTTALLCSLCSQLEKEGADWAMPPDVRAWWKKHQEMDKARRIVERYEAAVRGLQGIQKTIKDIESLGGEPGKALKKALTEAEKELAAASEESEKNC